MTSEAQGRLAQIKMAQIDAQKAEMDRLAEDKAAQHAKLSEERERKKWVWGC